MLTAFAAIVTLLSAASLHAASVHGRWPAGVARRWLGRKPIGIVLAIVGLVAFTARLGLGVGACAMLGTWMLAFVALTYAMGLRAGDPR